MSLVPNNIAKTGSQFVAQCLLCPNIAKEQVSFVTIVLLGWRGAFLVAYVIAECEQILPRLGHSSFLNVSCAQILHKLSNTAQMSNTAQTEQHGTN